MVNLAVVLNKLGCSEKLKKRFSYETTKWKNSKKIWYMVNFDGCNVAIVQIDNENKILEEIILRFLLKAKLFRRCCKLKKVEETNNILLQKRKFK